MLRIEVAHIYKEKKDVALWVWISAHLCFPLDSEASILVLLTPLPHMPKGSG